MAPNHPLPVPPLPSGPGTPRPKTANPAARPQSSSIPQPLGPTPHTLSALAEDFWTGNTASEADKRALREWLRALKSDIHADPSERAIQGLTQYLNRNSDRYLRTHPHPNSFSWESYFIDFTRRQFREFRRDWADLEKNKAEVNEQLRGIRDIMDPYEKNRRLNALKTRSEQNVYREGLLRNDAANHLGHTASDPTVTLNFITAAPGPNYSRGGTGAGGVPTGPVVGNSAPARPRINNLNPHMDHPRATASDPAVRDRTIRSDVQEAIRMLWSTSHIKDYEKAAIKGYIAQVSMNYEAQPSPEAVRAMEHFFSNVSDQFPRDFSYPSTLSWESAAFTELKLAARKFRFAVNGLTSKREEVNDAFNYANQQTNPNTKTYELSKANNKRLALINEENELRALARELLGNTSPDPLVRLGGSPADNFGYDTRLPGGWSDPSIILEPQERLPVELVPPHTTFVSPPPPRTGVEPPPGQRPPQPPRR